MIKIGDIDIDCQNRNKILSLINHIPASLQNNKKHPSGVYAQNVPINPSTGYALVDFHNNTFQKIDFLNLDILSNFLSNKMLLYYMEKEPKWELLLCQDILNKLPHLSKHLDIIKKYKPKSVEDLAIILALIRPGKKNLIGKSLVDIQKDIWIPVEEYYLKKSHAISYALLCITMLNFVEENLEF